MNGWTDALRRKPQTGYTSDMTQTLPGTHAALAPGEYYTAANGVRVYIRDVARADAVQLDNEAREQVRAARLTDAFVQDEDEF